MRLALLLATCLALVACGGRPPPGDPARDGGPPGDGQLLPDARADSPQPHIDAAPHDGGVPSCSGPGSLTLNGAAVPVTVSGRMVFLNCCEAAEFVFDPAGTLGTRVVVMWRAQVGQPTAIPFSVDLADLPDGVGVQVLSGCGDPPEYCPNPTDTLSSGFQGTLTVTGETGLGYTMTLCMRADAPAGETHPVLRTLDLWAEDVVAPYPYD
jgi:hypothetical protein